MVRLKFFLLFVLLSACTKEVNIPIPGFEEQLVVEGRIETDGFPLIVLSKSANIYESTDLESYINSFIEDAIVQLSDGENSVLLEATLISELPVQSIFRMAEIFDLEPEEVVLLPIKVFTTSDVLFQGKVGHRYDLQITYNGEEIEASTFILSPVALDSVYWLPTEENTEYGTSWARLSDPLGVFNAYRWEVKRVNLKNGQEKDLVFKSPRNGFFSDDFIDGQSIQFDYPNPMKRKDSTHLREFKRYYRLYDTVVVKFSTMDDAVFEYFRTKRAQIVSSNDPFATPINVRSNLTGPALGIWAGFSPSYDTLICTP